MFVWPHAHLLFVCINMYMCAQAEGVVGREQAQYWPKRTLAKKRRVHTVLEVAPKQCDWI